MDNTHEIVERLAREKQSKEVEKEMLELANADINTFIMSCRMSGFKSGLKVGFWIGMMVAIIIYFVVN